MLTSWRDWTFVSPRRGFFFPVVIYYKQVAPTELNQPGKS